MTYTKRQQLLPYKPAPNVGHKFGPKEIIKGEPFVSPKGFRPDSLLRLGYRLVYQFSRDFSVTATWMHHLKIPSTDELVPNYWVTHSFYYYGTGQSSAPIKEPQQLQRSKGFTSLAELLTYMMLTYPDSHEKYPEQLQLAKEQHPECFI